MIKLNGYVINQNHFLDNSLRIEYPVGATDCFYSKSKVIIDWLYDNDSELFTLICLTKKIRDWNKNAEITLKMPYIPHARMDREKTVEDTFTLSYFADIINNLEFDEVSVLDPHSNVATALIKRNSVKPTCATLCFNKLNMNNTVFLYPDEGASKRYSEIYTHPYAIGMKRRDWKTGNITSYDIIENAALVEGSDILIIDDICCKGGTFYYAAKKLKELGAKDIYLYVSHCENSILQGDLINCNDVKKIFTTDTICTIEHPKIEFVQSFRN